MVGWAVGELAPSTPPRLIYNADAFSVISETRDKKPVDMGHHHARYAPDFGPSVGEGNIRKQ